MAVERGAAQQGQTVRLKLLFSLAGSPVDPFQIRLVEIRSFSNAVLASFSGASIVREGVGIYFVDWPIPISEPTNVHFDRWYATASSGGTEEQFTEHFLVLPFSATTLGASYMTIGEARAYIPEDTLITDVQLADLIADCQEVVEEVSGYNFLPRTEARRFDGTGRPALSVTRPILRVSEARILSCQPGCSDGSDDRIIDPCVVRIDRSGTILALGNVARYSERVFGIGRTMPPWFAGSCGIWPAGFQNIQITGDWGRYETVPRTIKVAMGMLLREATRCDDPKGAPSAAFSAESIPGDRQYTLAKVWNNVTLDNATGYPDVDRILARHKPKVMMGVV